MLSVKSDMGMAAIQRYINKEATKGYCLKLIVPFILFPPLHFLVFTFKKTDKKQIGYLVEYQRFEDDSLEKTYIQDMKDQGWTLFTNVPVSFRNNGEFIFLYRSSFINITDQSHKRRFDKRCTITISTWLYFSLFICYLFFNLSPFKLYKYFSRICISLFLFDYRISDNPICIY